MIGDIILSSQDEKQYAYYQLSRFCQSVKAVDCNFYDYIVTADMLSNKFAVVVVNAKNANDTLQNVVNNYRINLDGQNISSQLFVPLIFLFVDLMSGMTKFQIVLEWNYGIPKVGLNNSKVTWNENNYINLCHQLDGTIRTLPLQMWRVIKRIHIAEPTATYMDFIYCRNISDSYRMAEQPKLSELEVFYRTLHGVPENEYPSDKLDSMIFEVIKNSYPSAEVTSSLMVVNADLKNMQRYATNNSMMGDILVMPKFSPNEFLSAFPGGILPRIGLSVFNVISRDGVQGVNCSFVFQAESIYEMQTIDKLSKETYQPLTHFLVK